MATPDDVLEFWFGEPIGTEEELWRKVKFWFKGGPAVDEVIRERFGTDVDLALEGKLEDWAGTPRGVLALVLLLDQFTRGIYRDSPRAFAGDERAQALAQRAFDGGMERDLAIFEKQFLAMPFLHAEDPALQARALEQAQRRLAEAPESQKRFFSDGIEQTRKYQEVIRRFGRFPHRNAVLGRESTPEEAEFLKDWAAKAAPTGVREKLQSG